jgi:putative PIN family toxin of toxin-antitoxin system
VRVVLDTSVVITAIRSSTGAAAEVLRLALLSELTILMDYKLASEYRAVSLRQHHVAASGKTPGELTLLLDALEAIAEPVLVLMRHHPLSQDANDDMVLDVAINSSADAVVTGNTRHFREPASRFHLNLFTPAELLQELRRRKT